MSKAAKLYAIAGTALCIVFYGSLPSFPKPAVIIASHQSVDRSHKGDRSSGFGMAAMNGARSTLTRAEKRVPVGCDRAFGSMSSSQFATLFGRCLV
jgi:hypothetical protein